MRTYAGKDPHTSQREIFSQRKQWALKSYFVYYEVPIVNLCGKRSAEGLKRKKRKA